MNPQIDPVAAKRLLDDPTLDRIIAVVGKASRQPDRDALRRDLLSCYGRYLAQPDWLPQFGLVSAGAQPWGPCYGRPKSVARHLSDTASLILFYGKQGDIIHGHVPRQ